MMSPGGSDKRQISVCPQSNADVGSAADARTQFLQVRLRSIPRACVGRTSGLIGTPLAREIEHRLCRLLNYFSHWVVQHGKKNWQKNVLSCDFLLTRHTKAGVTVAFSFRPSDTLRDIVRKKLRSVKTCVCATRFALLLRI